MVAAMSIELGFSTWKHLIQCFEDRSRCILLKGLGVQHDVQLQTTYFVHIVQSILL